MALVRIDPVPETRTLVAEERYADAADYLGFFMDYDYVQQDPRRPKRSIPRSRPSAPVPLTRRTSSRRASSRAPVMR